MQANPDGALMAPIIGELNNRHFLQLTLRTWQHRVREKRLVRVAKEGSLVTLNKELDECFEDWHTEQTSLDEAVRGMAFYYLQDGLPALLYYHSDHEAIRWGCRTEKEKAVLLRARRVAARAALELDTKTIHEALMSTTGIDHMRWIRTHLMEADPFETT